MRQGSWTSILALVASLTLLAGAAHAGIPTDQLRGATDRVLKILQDAELKQPAKKDARRQQIRAVADEIFDWQETGKRALARHWQGRSPSEREEFSTLFADLIERSYISKIEQYSGERVVYAGETVEGDQATVRTKLITKSNTEIPIDYRMRKEGDRWRAYDVVIEGVSLVSNYRTQFNKIIQQSGYGELVKKLKAKEEEVQFETGQTKS
ncbi:MAG TPA: ABC transporter substrate-binding protein [Methylomirabilota bacterium]